MENLTREDKLKALALAAAFVKKAPETTQFYLFITEEADDPVQLDFAPMSEEQYDLLAILVGKRRTEAERKERVHSPIKGLKVTIYGTDGPFVKPGACAAPTGGWTDPDPEDEFEPFDPDTLSPNARDFFDKYIVGEPDPFDPPFTTEGDDDVASE